MKVFFINSKKKSCGVYQYGIRLLDALQFSNNEIQYYEVSTFEEFCNLDFKQVDLLLFNFIGCDGTGPFGWYNKDAANYVRDHLKIKTATIKHTADNFVNFDYYICQDPTNQTIPSLPRPLHKPINYSPSNKIINVGSFGFAGYHKGFDSIIKLVNDQFDEAIINLLITSAFYGDKDNVTRDTIISQLSQIQLKPGIQLNIQKDFIDDDAVSEFAVKNDILIFAYNHLLTYAYDPCAISSIADYAISWNIPFAVTSLPAFRHLYKEEIDVNKNSIVNILNYHKEYKYVQQLNSEWSQKNLSNKFDQILKQNK
jgi:hypothetical protein